MKEFIEKLIEKLEEKKAAAENEMRRLRSENYTLLCRFDRADIEENTSESFKEAIEIVNELAEEYKGGWIPCSERLPETDERCLIYYKSIIGSGVDIDKFEGEKFEFYGIKNVIAWQPLPKPYKKGSETDE